MPPRKRTKREWPEKARELEEKFNWLEAIKLYEEWYRSKKLSGPDAGNIWERIGYCRSRESTQAQDNESFRKLRQQSVEDYKKAAQHFTQEENLSYQGRNAQCNAMAQYMKSWLIPNPTDKRKVLEECLSLGNKSLEIFRKIDDELNYGRMCNQLLQFTLERHHVASDSTEMKKIGRKGIDHVKTCLKALSKLDNKKELLKAYSTASLLVWFAQGCMPEQKDLAKRSLEYSEKALQLSTEVDDAYNTSISYWAAALCKLLFTEEALSAMELAEKMLEYSTKARDNYLKGAAHYVLAFITNWLAIREANPDNRRKGHEKTIKHAKEGIRFLRAFSQDFLIAETSLFYSEAYSSLASDFATSLPEKNSKLEKAIEIGRSGLEHATRSGSPDPTGSTLHALSKALHFYSKLKTTDDEKTKILEEALDHRKKYIAIVDKAFQVNDWVAGVGKNYEGLLKADLAKIEPNNEKQEAILKDAILDMEEGVKRCKRWISSRPVPTLLVAVARFEDNFGSLLDKLWLLTCENNLMIKANEVYEDAAQNYKKVKLSSRVAESYWKKAQICDRLSKYADAAKDFERASIEYEAAARNIPQFADFYLDYASYMKAWSEIEGAKSAHKRKDYITATSHYRKSSDLLNQSKLWSYLSSNFLAWSFLEQAEDLSRKEKSDHSIEAFEKSIEVFSESKGFLRVELNKIEKSDERELVERLLEVSETRARYCNGRITLEEARISDKQGDHTNSAEKYGLAAQRFEQVMESESEQTRKELRPLVHLCHAWQKMMTAEASASPGTYGEAAELFILAKEYTLDQSTSLLALANSSFCKALEAGTEFEISREETLYLSAKRHMDTAASYYLKAGFKNASAYAEASQRLFDAYVFMDRAKRETEPDIEAKYYAMAEKVLQYSAGSFTQANHPEKTLQVQQLLEKVRKDRELALSLSEVLHAPTAVSTTASFVTPTANEEKAVGLERFENADIQAKIIKRAKEIRIGESFNLAIQIVNVGKESVLLDRIERIVPSGFDAISTPEYSYIEDSHLKMKGKQLEPLRTEEMILSLRPLDKGIFQIAPMIICVDQKGNQIDRKPQSVEIEVLDAILPGRITTGHGDLDKLLLGGLPEKYAVVLSSPSCDERDLLVRKFLETGAEKNHITFYITIEARGVMDLVEKFQSNFYVFICNPRADAMVENRPNVIKLKGVENLTAINIALTSVFRKLDPSSSGPRRACIEIVSDVLLQHHAALARKWLAGLIPDLRSENFITLAILNPRMHSSADVHAIVGLFEGEIRISQKETARGSQKFLKVEKLYDQRYLDSELPLRKEKLEI